MAAKKKSASKTKRKATKKIARKAAPKAAKRAVKRATTAKRAAKPAAAATKKGPVSVGRKPFSKSQFVSEISERTGVARKDVSAMMEAVAHIIDAHLQKSGPEMFSWPGMFKILVIKKPATKARQGVNPFTGETMMFKAKPASRRVKIRALKQLKEMAA
ncbi:MAG: HU family DNA-binding protein [Gammaproteobacteria bacterium]|jgi:nucleoid DNA-binding protein|nr:HU family DNA-binding protein [Gammaproteobacteria bacterium]